MPNYEVLTIFKDKNTKRRYEIGSIYPTDDTERAEELQEKGFIGEQVKGKGKVTGQLNTDDKGDKGAKNDADDPK